MALQASINAYGVDFSNMSGQFCIQNNTQQEVVLMFADPIGQTDITQIFSGENKQFLGVNGRYCPSYTFQYGDGISVLVGAIDGNRAGLFVFFSGAYGPQITEQPSLPYLKACYEQKSVILNLEQWQSDLMITPCKK